MQTQKLKILEKEDGLDEIEENKLPQFARIDGVNPILMEKLKDTKGILNNDFDLKNVEGLTVTEVKDLKELDIDEDQINEIVKDDDDWVNKEDLTEEEKEFFDDVQKQLNEKYDRDAQAVERLKSDVLNDDWNPGFLRDLFHYPDHTEPLRIAQLKYWALYPRKVRQWVLYTKSTKGYFNEWGRWVPVEDLTHLRVDKDSSKKQEELIKWEDYFQQEQNKLEDIYKGQYRFNVQPEEIKNIHPKVKLLFSFTNAKDKEKTAFKKKVFFENFKESENDTGNSAVQVAMLTIRIRSLINHLKKNKKDKHNKRNLYCLVSRRKSLMKCLKRDNVEKYYRLLMDLKLTDSVETYKNF